MANELLHDMVKVKRSRKPLARKEVKAPPRKVVRKKRPKSVIPQNPTPEPKQTSKFRIFLLAFLVVLGLLFALSYLFSKAKVTIEPTSSQFAINDTITAAKDLNNSSLPFDLVVLSGEEKKNMKGGQVEDVAYPAKGKVIIYNNYSSASQTLDIDTRLEGTNGKIYKTEKRIVVPGKTGDKPGSIEVGVYASSAGESYNSTPLDFKIVGFKGSPKYAGFYARSTTDLVGGFTGKAPVVSELEKTSVRSELEAALKKKLLNKIIDQIPDGFVLYEDAVLVEMNSGSTVFTPLEGDFVEASLKGTLYGFIFDEEKLTKKLAMDVLENYKNEDVFIRNIKSLKFEFVNPESISFSNLKTVTFKLSGEPLFVYRVNDKEIVDKVIGKEKDFFNELLNEYPNIESAEIVFRPFWKKSFPEERDAIEVIVNYP